MSHHCSSLGFPYALRSLALTEGRVTLLWVPDSMRQVRHRGAAMPLAERKPGYPSIPAPCEDRRTSTCHPDSSTAAFLVYRRALIVTE